MKKAPTINPVIFRSYADAFSYVLLLMYCYLFIDIYFSFAAPQPEHV